MQVTLVLGLDIGSTSTKAALVDVTAGVRVRHVERRPTPSAAADLIAVAAETMRACAARADAPIVAVGIASMAESGVALDAAGDALTPLLRWDRAVDSRHLRALLVVRAGLPARTGVPATTKPAAVVLTSLRAERPEVLGAARHWAGAADLVVHALTGTRAIDHTLAARTMLATPDGSRWDVALLRDLGLDAALLPDVRSPGEPAGRTHANAATFGLPEGVPVHIAGHDHAVGAWAAGARRPGDATDSLGTAEAVVRIAEDPDRAAATADGFAVSRTVDGTALTVLGGSPACGALLVSWEQEHPGSLAVLQDADPEHWITSTTTIAPYPAGRQCPRPDAGARLGTRGSRGTDDDARALLQSLVLHARWMRETADRLSGSAASSLMLIGSLAERIPAWAPLAATAGTPTRRCTAAEPVAAGAALLAAVREHACPEELTLPSVAVQPATAPGFDDAFRRFLDAVGAEEAASGPRASTEGES